MNFFGRMWGDKLDNVPNFMCDSVSGGGKLDNVPNFPCDSVPGPNLIEKTKDLYKKYC